MCLDTFSPTQWSLLRCRKIPTLPMLVYTRHMIQSMVSIHSATIGPFRPILAGGSTKTWSTLRIILPNLLALPLQLQLRSMTVVELLALLSNFNAGTSRKEGRSIAVLNAPRVTTTARTYVIIYEAGIPAIDVNVPFKVAGGA